jgi:hypothetical protein
MNARAPVSPDIARDQLFKIYKGLRWFRGIYCSPYNGRPAIHITVTDCQAARNNGVPDNWSGFRVYLWRV